jgi:hypothetical protein
MARSRAGLYTRGAFFFPLPRIDTRIITAFAVLSDPIVNFGLMSPEMGPKYRKVAAIQAASAPFTCGYDGAGKSACWRAGRTGRSGVTEGLPGMTI